MASIDAINSFIETALSFKDISSESVPAPIRVQSAGRSGISIKKIMYDIVAEHNKYGYVTTDLEDGSPNQMIKSYEILVTKIIDAIRYESKIETAIKPYEASIVINGIDSNGGPVTGTGQIINFQEGGTTIS